MKKINITTLVKKPGLFKNLHGNNYIKVDMSGESMGLKPGDIIKIVDSLELVIGFTDKDGKLEGPRELVWTLPAYSPGGIQEYATDSGFVNEEHLLKAAREPLTPETIETAIREFEEFVNSYAEET